MNHFNKKSETEIASSTLGSKSWNPWPISIIAFLCLAISACAAFVTFCCANPSELVASDYYEQEIGHQEKMDRVNRALALPVKASVTYAEDSRELLVAIPAQPPVSGKIKMYRASSSGMDSDEALSLDPMGRQSIDISALALGPWKVSIIWTAQGQSFEIEEAFVIKAKREIGGS